METWSDGLSPQGFCSGGRRQHCRAAGARSRAARQTEALSPCSSSGYPRTTNERSFTTVMDKHARLHSWYKSPSSGFRFIGRDRLLHGSDCSVFLSHLFPLVLRMQE